MPINLTLQGSMAAGKSTAVRYVARHCPGIHISHENPAPMLAEIKARGLNQMDRDGFMEIQRIFIAAELRCWEEAQRYPATLFDLGVSEIEFYTLFFPRSIGMDWDMETLLHGELTALRRCKPDAILFLDASMDTLRQYKENDPDRKRGSFEHYVTQLLPAKKRWFADKEDPRTVFAQVDGMDRDVVGRMVLQWVCRNTGMPSLGNTGGQDF